MEEPPHGPAADKWEQRMRELLLRDAHLLTSLQCDLADIVAHVEAALLVSLGARLLLAPCRAVLQRVLAAGHASKGPPSHCGLCMGGDPGMSGMLVLHSNAL
jgi:hypothetical protein